MAFSVKYVYQAVDKYSAIVEKMGKSTNKFRRAQVKARNVMRKFSATLKTQVGDLLKSKLAIAAVAAAVVLFMRSTFNAFRTFETSMNRVSAITLGTTEEIAEMAKVAKKMGATTQFTASQAANALTFLAQAGLSVQESMAALPGTLQLAAAGGIDLATAADIATNVLAQNLLKVKDLARVNDVLSLAQAKSNTNILQLAGAMNTIGPTAVGMGIDIELLTASLGTMANAGLKAENAGTLFRNMLLKTAVGAKKNAKTYRSLGINIKDFIDKTGKFKDFTGFIRAMEDASKAGKLTIPIMNKLFGERGFRAAQVLVNAGADSLENFNVALKGAAGTAKEMAERQMAGLSGATKELASVWESFKIEILDKSIFGMMTVGVIKLMTNVIRFLTPSGKLSKSIGDLIRTVGIALGPLAKFFGVIAGYVILKPFKSVLDAIVTFIRLFTSGLLVAIRAIETLGIVMGAFATGGFKGMASAVKSQLASVKQELKDIWADPNTQKSIVAGEVSSTSNANINLNVNDPGNNIGEIATTTQGPASLNVGRNMAGAN